MSEYKKYTFIDILKKSGEIKTVEDALLYTSKKLALKYVCGGAENEITDDYIHKLMAFLTSPAKEREILTESLFIGLINDSCLEMNKSINDVLSNIELINQESYETKQNFINIKVKNKLVNENFEDISERLEALENENDILTQKINCNEKKNIDNKLINENFEAISERLEALETENDVLTQKINCYEKKNIDNKIDDIIKRMEFLENKNEKLIQKNNHLAKKIDILTKRLPIDIINVDNNSFVKELTDEFIVF